MSVSVRKSDGQVFVQWNEQGIRKRKYFGSGPMARTMAEVFNAEVTNMNVFKRDPHVVLFGDLAQEYLNKKTVELSEVSYKNTQWKLQSIILPVLGDLPVKGITHRVLDKYIETRARKVKMTTIHRELSDVKAIFNWSVKRRLIDVSPMLGYDMPTRDDAIIQPPSQEEIEAIISHSAEHLQRAMLLSYFLGLRPGAVELLSLRYHQINWSKNTLTVVSAAKGGISRREVPIHVSLPLASWFEKDGSDRDGYIITWMKKPIRSLKTAFNAAKKRAGMGSRKIPLYSLRHAFVTTLLQEGIDVYTIASISGHNVHTLLESYAHSSNNVRINAINALPNLVISAPSRDNIAPMGAMEITKNKE